MAHTNDVTLRPVLLLLYRTKISIIFQDSYPLRRFFIVTLTLQVLLLLVFYLPHIGDYFIGDDFPLILLARHYGPSYWLPGTDRFQPVVSFFFRTDWMLWGLNQLGYHLSNLVFAAIGLGLLSWLTYLVINNRKAVFISGLAFAIFPTHPEGVLWIAARCHLLVTIFTLLALICFIGFLRSQNWKLYGVVLLSVAGAFLSRETAVSLPLALLLVDALLFRNNRRLVQRIAIHLPYWAILGLLLD